MRNRIKRSIGMGAFVVSLLVGAAQHGSLALGQAKPEDENLPRVVPGPSDQPPEPQEYFDKRLLAAAKEAYEVALEEFKAERITDLDLLYRWSLRWMMAEQAAGDDPVAAAKGHLRRMEGELVQVYDQLPRRKKATEDELKYFITSTRFYFYEAMEQVKKAEQAQLAKRAATPDEVVAPSPDAAVKAAETYLGAVLEGNYDEAAELAVPGSLATSRRLMDSIKGLIGGKSIGVLAIQNSGRRTTVLMQVAQSADNTADSRGQTQFTVVLEPKGDRWLVTNFSVHRNPRQDRSQSTATRTPASEETDVAAHQAAQEYLGAILQGHFDVAAARSVGGSATASRKGMERLKEMVNARSIPVVAVQLTGRGTAIALTEDVQLTKPQPDGSDKGPLVITLKLENDQWLVSDLDFGAKALEHYRKTALSRLPESEGDGPKDETTTKQIRVISLKHAKAADLAKTISELLDVRGSDLRMSVDARTNRVLIHGPQERIDEVSALIQALDEPSAVTTEAARPGPP
jgi:hypothetical protein